MTTAAMTALSEIDRDLFRMMGVEEPQEATPDEIARDVVEYLARQNAPAQGPDHLGTLVRALLDGGEDAAIGALADMHDIASDAVRESLLARAELIVSGMRVLDRAKRGMLSLQEVAVVVGGDATYWTIRAWVFQGCPHEGYGLMMTCDPAKLAAWCEVKAASYTAPWGEPHAMRLRDMARRLSEYAALQAA